jgi:nitronate monooxygenase
MVNCSKCGAELIGLRKFCAACGAPAATSVAPLRAAAEARGSTDFTPLWSGQNASGCKPLGAAELTSELIQAFQDYCR